MTAKRKKPVSHGRGAVAARCRQGARWSRAGLRHGARGGGERAGAGRKGALHADIRLEADAPGRGARGLGGTRRPTVPVPAASQIRSPPVETARLSVYSAELVERAAAHPRGGAHPGPSVLSAVLGLSSSGAQLSLAQPPLCSRYCSALLADLDSPCPALCAVHAAAREGPEPRSHPVTQGMESTQTRNPCGRQACA